jgi:hypothetical protein
MEVGFEFDPNEKVRLGSRPMTLSRAVREYREMQVAAIATRVCWDSGFPWIGVCDSSCRWTDSF